MYHKMKVYLMFCMVLALLVMGGVVVAQDEVGPEPVGLRWDAPTYALHGPYWIGAREIEVQNGERLLKGTVWYPALNSDGAAYEDYGYSTHSEEIWEGWGMGAEWSVLSGKALADAPVDVSGAPYPLIVLTHGFAVSRTVVAYLGEHLASYGFVVMAVDHPGGGFIDQLTYGLGPELHAFLPESYTYWVLDELRVIEYASQLTSSAGDFNAAIDTSRVGAMGYSSGGNVALQLAGAQFDLASLSSDFAEVCDLPEDHPSTEEIVVCGFPAIEADLAEMAGVDFVAGQPWGVVPESAVQAVFAIAPGSVIPFGASGVSVIDVPMVIIAGTQDLLASTVQYTYDNLNSSMQSLVWLENANHFAFMNCGWQTEFFGGFCADSVWDRFRVYDLTNHFATALFMGVLYDDADALAALQASAIQIPGVSYQTSMGE